MTLENTAYPRVEAFVEYNSQLIVNERIKINKPRLELTLRKPEKVTYLEIKNSKKITEDRDSIHICLKDKRKEVEVQYAIDAKGLLFLDWIMAPEECYTIDMTVKTPLPLKSIINATAYGFHAWGRYGYSRWINPSPRRNYALTIDEYFIIDKKEYIITSTDKYSLSMLDKLLSQIYLKSIEIMPWRKPIIIYNSKVPNTALTNMIFISNINSISEMDIYTLLVKAIIDNLKEKHKTDELINAVSFVLSDKRDYERLIMNPYVGLIYLYGEKIIRILLEEMLTKCYDNIEQLIGNAFKKPLSNIILSLLQRGEPEVLLNDNKIICNKGPCIVTMVRDNIEFLKTILMEGEELLLNTRDNVRFNVYIF